MKIVEQTPTKLVLRNFPGFMAYFAISWLVLITIPMSGILLTGQIIILSLPGFIMCLVFLAAICRLVEIVTCTFDKSLSSMILKRQTPLKTQLIEHSIEEILGVNLEVINVENLDLYRVSIVFTFGESVPLNSVYSRGLRDKEKTAKDIATFLNVSNYGFSGRN
jgi:hypothetical protein